MAHHRPRTLTTLTLLNAPNYPASAISYFGDATTLVDKDIELWIGTVGGSQLGKVRLRGTPTTDGAGGSILPIAESGSALVNWAAATTIVAKERYYPYPRHPRYVPSASQWRMDYNRVWPGSVIGPYANMGAPIVGFLENGSFTASFFNTDHLFWDAASLSVIWEFPNGSAVHNSGSSFSVTFTGASPSGSYILCTVVDESGASETSQRLIFVFDDETQVPHVNVGEIQGGLDSKGYRVAIEVLDDGHDIQNDAEIVIFSKNIYNTSASQFGGNSRDRGNILFHGFVSKETVQRKPFQATVTMEAVTLDGILKETNSYDTFFAKKSNPTDDWIHEPALNLDRVAMRLLKERSTVSRIADFHPMSGIGITNGLILFQDLPKSSIWEQLTQNYGQKGVMGVIACDMQGGLHAFQDAQISGGSASLPVVLSLRDEDLMDQIDYNYEHIDKNAYVRLEAVTSDTPLGAESPGGVQGYFGGEQQITRGLTTQSQEELITWSGNLRAKLNNKLPNVTAKLAGNYVIDAIPQHAMRLSMAASQNPRGFAINNDLFLQKNLRLEYKSSDQFMTATIDMEKSVNGIGGSAITFPRTTDIIPIPTQTPPPPPDPVGETPGGGFGTVYVATGTTLGRTRAFSADSPSWVNITPSGVTDIYDFILDPWSPSTNGYLSTSLGLYKSTTLDLDTPSWDLVLTAASASAAAGGVFANPYKVMGSINLQNYVVLFFQDSSDNDLWCARSLNAGTTWSYAQVNNNPLATGATWRGGADIVPHVINDNLTLYAILFRQAGRGELFRSQDKGATWTRVIAEIFNAIAGTTVNALCVHCPYNDNDNGNIVYMSWNRVGDSPYAYYTTDAATVNVINGNTKTNSKRHGIETYTQDRQRVFHWTYTSKLYLSTDGGSSFSLTTANGVTGDVRATGGFPFNRDQYYVVTTGSTGGIFVSTDNGVSFSSKIGNWTGSGLSSISIGRGVIVPDWTE